MYDLFYPACKTYRHPAYLFVRSNNMINQIDPLNQDLTEAEERIVLYYSKMYTDVRVAALIASANLGRPIYPNTVRLLVSSTIKGE